jgi:hypothetical protein
VDYKSSKWAKSADDVHADLQMWAYNFAIHELYPECDRLIQVYDQLRYGQLSTRKTAAQREQMREWLTINVEAILDDDDVRDDGLLKPTYNRWCPWCPVLESCSVVNDLTEFAATRIATLAPTVKEGRRQVVQVEPAKIEEYASVMDKSRVAVRVLERFQDAVKDMLRDMPDEDRYELGYELADRENTVFPPAAIERISEALGPDFFEAAKITKTGLQTVLSDRPDLLAWALEQGVKESKTPVLQRRKEDEPE